jgi:uncharacterized protein YmfQ (DUF2313 family)
MAVEALDLDTQAQRLADYLPGGRIFKAKNLQDSNLRRLLRGIGHELFTADGYLRDFQDDIAPSITEYFIDEWESALGIPDSCFAGDGSLTERRRDIVIKLASLGVQSADDFVELGAMFGVTVTVRSGRYFSVFPLVFPVLLFSTDKESRFTIVVDFTVEAASKFPLTFPFTFGTEATATLECLFRRLKPGNCDIIFRQV